MIPGRLQNWLDFAHDVELFQFGVILTQWNRLNWGFRRISLQLMGRSALNWTCLCVLTTSGNDCILVMVCWFSPFWWHFDLVKQIKRVWFSGIFVLMLGKNWLKFGMLIFPDHLQNWLYFAHGLLVFFHLGPFWLSETYQIRCFLDDFFTTHGRNGIIFRMLMCRDHLWKWVHFGHGLLIFFTLASL